MREKRVNTEYDEKLPALVVVANPALHTLPERVHRRL